MMVENKRKIYKPGPVKGFPEWLPEVRRVEQMWFDHIRRIFESYGFCNIETPSVEELAVINAKGGDGGADADKEIYVIERLHKEEGDKEARLALHFDQTVPLARYTAQHFNDIVFPFKRYQMQRVWRGERPQAGRFREFYQCDIDVINVDNLPLHFDAEMPAIIWEILNSLPCIDPSQLDTTVPLTYASPVEIRISNRKILFGYLKSIGIEGLRATQVSRVFDKIGKIPHSLIHIELKQIAENDAQHDHLIYFLGLIYKKYPTSNALETELKQTLLKRIIYLDSYDKSFETGIEELSFVLDQLAHLPEGAVVADLSIVRGLDYYTGTVYETVFVDHPEYGSICSGGRYDDLAGNYISKHLPGVGISIGFSRLFDRLRQQGKLPLKGISPAQILITLEDESLRPRMMQTAQTLRARGLNVETYHIPAKLKKQLEYATKKGIRYIWLLPFEDRTSDEVKDMEARTQTTANPKDWKTS